MGRLGKALVRVSEIKERALRMMMPSRMHFFHRSWPLSPEGCPCDIHLCDYLVERRIRQRAIFHFGTGDHHIVGLRNRDDGLSNDILALTTSPAELERYVAQVIRDASLGRHYRVLFADIYDLSAACLPTFDIVTLFHLCEYTKPESTGRRMDDAGVLELLLSKLAPRGRVLFYSGSFGRAQAAPLIARAVADGRMSFEEEYRSLLVYRTGPTPT